MVVGESRRRASEALVLHSETEEFQSPGPGLMAVLDIRSAFSALPKLEQVIGNFMENIVDLLDVEKAGVMLYDSETNQLVLQFPALGVDDGLFRYCRIRLDSTDTADAFLDSAPCGFGQSRNQPAIIHDLVRLFRARSIITSPLRVKKRFIGMVYVCDKRKGPFPESDWRLLEIFAKNLAATIESTRLCEMERERVRQLEKLNENLSRERDCLERSSNAHAKLVHTLLHGHGVDGSARALAGLLENPVALEDRFFQLISYAPWPIRGRSSTSIASDFVGTTAAAIVDPRFREQVQLAKLDGRPVRMPPYPEYGLSHGRMIVALTVGEKLLGYLSVFEKDRQLTQPDIGAMEQAAAIFALALLQQKAAFEVDQRLRGEFLDDLLAGNFASAEVLLRRAAPHGCSLAKPHAIMIVDVESCDCRSLENDRGLLEAVAVKEKLLRTVDAVVGERCPGSLVASRGDDVVVLLNLSSAPWETNKSSRPQEIAEAVMHEVKTLCPRLTLSIAVGSKGQRAEECRRAYQVARKSLDIIRAFNQRDRIVTFDRLGAYELLLQTEDQTELKAFVDRSLGPLVSYDERHNASLVETLETYLKNDCNLQKTARASYLHVNTVKYRLQRIEDLTKVDLSDAETRLDLHLGLKVWRLIA